ncbi:uncharacterized protein LOC141849854 [Brevipalpus obovatus]|uniref:uncharacterized protein LOC141849854 n=1 Tax=Brevipalpus obovatus TaxID=246614 RepID=UPI003D9E683A
MSYTSATCTATVSPSGPPHFVDLHVDPGESVSIQLFDGTETVLRGPATVTMISQHAYPPVPMPVQVPPGHLVQQIVDENGTLRHIILSAYNNNGTNPTPPPPPGTLMPSHQTPTGPTGYSPYCCCCCPSYVAGDQSGCCIPPQSTSPSNYPFSTRDLLGPCSAVAAAAAANCAMAVNGSGPPGQAPNNSLPTQPPPPPSPPPPTGIHHTTLWELGMAHMDTSIARRLPFSRSTSKTNTFNLENMSYPTNPTIRRRLPTRSSYSKRNSTSTTLNSTFDGISSKSGSGDKGISNRTSKALKDSDKSSHISPGSYENGTTILFPSLNHYSKSDESKSCELTNSTQTHISTTTSFKQPKQSTKLDYMMNNVYSNSPSIVEKGDKNSHSNGKVNDRIKSIASRETFSHPTTTHHFQQSSLYSNHIGHNHITANGIRDSSPASTKSVSTTSSPNHSGRSDSVIHNHPRKSEQKSSSDEKSRESTPQKKRAVVGKSGAYENHHSLKSSPSHKAYSSHDEDSRNISNSPFRLTKNSSSAIENNSESSLPRSVAGSPRKGSSPIVNGSIHERSTSKSREDKSESSSPQSVSPGNAVDTDNRLKDSSLSDSVPCNGPSELHEQSNASSFSSSMSQRSIDFTSNESRVGKNESSQQLRKSLAPSTDIESLLDKRVPVLVSDDGGEVEKNSPFHSSTHVTSNDIRPDIDEAKYVEDSANSSCKESQQPTSTSENDSNHDINSHYQRLPAIRSDDNRNKEYEKKNEDFISSNQSIHIDEPNELSSNESSSRFLKPTQSSSFVTQHMEREDEDDTNSMNTTSSDDMYHDEARKTKEGKVSPQRSPKHLLPKIQVFTLVYTSLTATSVKLKWTYDQTSSVDNLTSSASSNPLGPSLLNETRHFMVEMMKNNQTSVKSGSVMPTTRIVYQGIQTSCRISHLSPQEQYSFRVRTYHDDHLLISNALTLITPEQQTLKHRKSKSQTLQHQLHSHSESQKQHISHQDTLQTGSNHHHPHHYHSQQQVTSHEENEDDSSDISDQKCAIMIISLFIVAAIVVACLINHLLTD